MLFNMFLSKIDDVLKSTRTYVSVINRLTSFGGT